VAVNRVEQDADGVRTVHLGTDDEAAAACPECGVFSTCVRQRRTTRPRDLPYGEVALEVRWHKRQFACRERLCKQQAFTESIDELPPYARITGRTRRAAAAAVGSGRSVAAAVTKELPMSWPIAHAAFAAHADRLLVEPVAPEVLGIDETRRRRPRWAKNEAGSWSRLERFETNFVDLSGPGGLLGQTAGRTSKTVVDWLDGRGEDWKAQVQVVVIDMCSPNRAAVQQALPDARLVADRFHLVRLANEMVPTFGSACSGTSADVAAGQVIRPGRTGGCCSAPATGSRTGRSPG